MIPPFPTRENISTLRLANIKSYTILKSIRGSHNLRNIFRFVEMILKPERVGILKRKNNDEC